MADDASKMFRKSAMEKLSSPEKLDAMMEITSPTAWLALSALGCILVFIVFWSIFGSIATKVQGKGILIRGEAVLGITAGNGGRVTEILVRPGEVVEKGQVVAQVDQTDLKLKLENERNALRDLEQQDVSQSEIETQSRERRLRALQRERSSLAASTRDYQNQARALRKRVASQQELQEKGLITSGQLSRTRAELASVEQAINQNNVRGAQIDAELTTLERELSLSKTDRENRIRDLKRRIAELENSLRASSQITSPYQGRILELATDVGNMVAAGTRILTLERLSAEIEARIYVPASDGKKILEGMRTSISPTTVKAEEYGTMVAQVKWVSDFPATPEGLRRTLRNDKLAADLSGKGAPIEVAVELIRDETTPSGFRWSSSQGPPVQIFSGTICNGNVTVSRRRPISLVIPTIKKTLGMTS